MPPTPSGAQGSPLSLLHAYHTPQAQSQNAAAFRQHHPAWDNTANHDHEDDDDEEDGDDAATQPGSSPKRKRQKTRANGEGASNRPMSVSCEKCKERKVKCDRGHPFCGWCVRNGQLCEYKEKKKPGLRAGYGRELETRLDRLEGVLQTQQHVLRQLLNAIPGAQSIVAPGFHQSPLPGEVASFLPDDPSTFPATSPQDAAFDASQRHLVVGPSPEQSQHTPQYPAVEADHHPSAGAEHMSFPTVMLHTPRELEPDSFQEPSPRIDTHPRPIGAAQDLPPYDLLYTLTDLFFKHINPWCPLLHRRSTLDALFGADNALSEPDRILLHAIVATSLRLSSDGRLTDELREQYHSRSKQKVLLYGLEHSSVRALQSLVILALDTTNGPASWNLLAVIARSTIQLGLAVESTSPSVAPTYPSIYTLRAMVLPEPESFIEDESRRRLFWMVYVLDRYATISTAFDFALNESEIDRKLPCREELWSRNQAVETKWFPATNRSNADDNQAENLGSFSYYIEVVCIMSTIHRFLKKPVDIRSLHDVEQWQQSYRQLDKELNQWKYSLPNEFSNMSRLFSQTSVTTASISFIMLHATFHTAVIRLHSSAAYPTTRSTIFAPSFSASQRCHTSATSICSLATCVRVHSLLTSLGPPFAFSLWVAARLLLVHGSTIEQKVNPEIHVLVSTLEEMGTKWKIAARYATLLSRVLDEYAESQQGPAVLENHPGRQTRSSQNNQLEHPPNNPSGERDRQPSTTPSSVRILADMRRTAFDLDFLISRQPRRGQTLSSFQQQQQRQGAASSSLRATPAPTPSQNPNTGMTFDQQQRNPSTTPAAGAAGLGPTTNNELDLEEYLDVFDFFNVPRLLPETFPLPQQGDGAEGIAQTGGAEGLGQEMVDPNAPTAEGGGEVHFNITNFMIDDDVNADWFGREVE